MPTQKQSAIEAAARTQTSPAPAAMQEAAAAPESSGLFDVSAIVSQSRSEGNFNPNFSRIQRQQMAGQTGQMGNVILKRAIHPGYPYVPHRTSILQRREVPSAPSLRLTQGDWHPADRQGETSVWKSANKYNLLHLRSGEYRQIEERRDFYRWFHMHTASQGYQTRWALAAWLVAKGANEIAVADIGESFDQVYKPVLSNEVQMMARLGNQIIFDDVFPKLQKLYLGGPLRGRAALEWDMQTLSAEQALVQSMYEGVSSDALGKFEAIAKKNLKTKLVAKLTQIDRVEAGRFNRGGVIPEFPSEWNILKAEDRWNYGMLLAASFSRESTTWNPAIDRMKPPNQKYLDGSQFERLNVRPNLHLLDAILNDSDVSETDVIQTMQKLSSQEQQELMLDSQRIDRLTHALNFAEVKAAILGLSALSLRRKLILLGKSLAIGWFTVSYSEISSLIRSATQSQKNELKSEYWKQIFVLICNDQTMKTALNDLAFDSRTRRTWTEAEE